MPRSVLALAASVVAVLTATASRYGYHRDELYFLAAGRRPAWGYPDQPPLTPLLARLADEVAPGSLTALRLLPALALAGVVLLTAVMARDLGAGRGGQLLAAACPAVGTVFVVTGHLHSTTTFDLLAWTALTTLLVRVLQGGDQRRWLAVGLVAGVGLLDKQLVAFLLAAVVAGLLLVGPRDVLRTPWPWAGGLLALALWAPHLLWQAREGWPALEVASSVAAGQSVSSEPPALFLPFQLVLVSPALVPVWVAGLVRLWRAPRLRCLALAYPLLAAVFLATGGKPYYLAGLYPLLCAAGAQPVLDRVGRRVATGLVAVAAVVSLPLGLPLLPVDRLGPVLALNEDAGETVGWPALVRTVEGVAPPGAVVLTQNYGQAGAVDRFSPRLAPAYSGHNGYGLWGPPPERALPVVAVGLPDADRERWLTGCRLAGVVEPGVDNTERGTRVHVCDGHRRTWAALWPQVRRLR